MTKLKFGQSESCGYCTVQADTKALMMIRTCNGNTPLSTTYFAATNHSRAILIYRHKRVLGTRTDENRCTKTVKTKEKSDTLKWFRHDKARTRDNASAIPKGSTIARAAVPTHAYSLKLRCEDRVVPAEQTRKMRGAERRDGRRGTRKRMRSRKYKFEERDLYIRDNLCVAGE